MNHDDINDLYAPVRSLDPDRTAKRNLKAGGYLKDASARASRSTWKLHELVCLIGHHGYTNLPIIQYAWQLSERSTRRTLSAYEKRGLIRLVNLPGSRRTLVGLTAWGAAEACAMINAPAKPLAPSRLARTLVDHTLAAQMAALQYDRANFKTPGLHLGSYAVEASIGHEFNGKAVRTDVLANGIAIEVELSRKSPKRLVQKMEHLAHALAQDKIKRAVYFAPAGPVTQGLTNAIKSLDSCWKEHAQRIDIVEADWIRDL